MSVRAHPRAGVRTVLVVLGVAVGASWWLVDTGWSREVDALRLLVFGFAAAATELLPMRQPGGRQVPTSIAVLGAAAVLGVTPLAVAAVGAAGWSCARVVDRGPLDLRLLALRVVGGWTLAGVAALGTVALPVVWTGDVTEGGTAADLQVGAAAAVAVAIVLGLPVIESAAGAAGRWRYLPRRIAEDITVTWLVGTALAATAVLGALVHPVLRHWTLPTILIPLLAARVGLDRFSTAARAYDQTIRAMSRLPEQLGRVSADHGVRVGQLAREVGLELGLDAATLAVAEHAAHLHELGRVQLERDAPVTRRELAAAGASVIQEAGSLDRVARIVAAHGDLAAPSSLVDDVRLPARIVAACCDVDRYAPDLEVDGQYHEVVVRLVRDVGDLDVVSALTRVLARRAAVARAPARRVPALRG